MPLLFLCARHARRVNSQVAEVDDVGAAGFKSKTRKRTAPRVSWIAQLAKEHGLEHLCFSENKAAGSSVEKRTPAGQAACVCIVKVQPGQLGEDLLTLWDQEEQYLLDFLFEGSLRRAFSLSVVKLVRFESPYWSQCPIRFRSDLWLPDSCKWSPIQCRRMACRQH